MNIIVCKKWTSTKNLAMFTYWPTPAFARIGWRLARKLSRQLNIDPAVVLECEKVISRTDPVIPFWYAFFLCSPPCSPLKFFRTCDVWNLLSRMKFSALLLPNIGYLVGYEWITRNFAHTLPLLCPYFAPTLPLLCSYLAPTKNKWYYDETKR